MYVLSVEYSIEECVALKYFVKYYCNNLHYLYHYSCIRPINYTHQFLKPKMNHYGFFGLKKIIVINNFYNLPL